MACEGDTNFCSGGACQCLMNSALPACPVAETDGGEPDGGEGGGPDAGPACALSDWIGTYGGAGSESIVVSTQTFGPFAFNAAVTLVPLSRCQVEMEWTVAGSPSANWVVVSSGDTATILTADPIVVELSTMVGVMPQTVTCTTGTVQLSGGSLSVNCSGDGVVTLFVSLGGAGSLTWTGTSQ
jgi:hypothetical protein